MKKVLLSLVAMAAMLITPTLAEADAYERPDHPYGTGTVVTLVDEKPISITCSGKRHRVKKGHQGKVRNWKRLKPRNGKVQVHPNGKRLGNYVVWWDGLPCAGGLTNPNDVVRTADALILDPSNTDDILRLVKHYLEAIGRDPGAQPRN